MQINKDPKYWDSELYSVYTPINRYYHTSVLFTKYKLWPDEFGVFNDKADTTHNCIPVISNELYQRINSELDGKHTIIHAHYIYKDLNWLPRMKKVRLYVEPEDYLFILILKVIKGFITQNIDTNDIWLRGFIRDHSKFPEITNTSEFWENSKRIQYIEMLMLVIGERDIRKFVKFYIDLWKRKCVKLEGYDDWIFLNPMNLFNNPNENMSQWVEVFDLDEGFDINILNQYHQANYDLIQHTLKYPYEELKHMDIEEVLVELFARNLRYLTLDK